MDHIATWVWICLAFGTALVAAAVWWVVRPARVLVRQKQRVTCPQLGVEVECVAVQHDISRRWEDIRSCEALPHPHEVTCDKGCLRALNRHVIDFGDGSSDLDVPADEIVRHRR